MTSRSTYYRYCTTSICTQIFTDPVQTLATYVCLYVYAQAYAIVYCVMHTYVQTYFVYTYIYSVKNIEDIEASIGVSCMLHNLIYLLCILTYS